MEKYILAHDVGTSGNKATLLYTDEQSAYTIIDRATVITNRDALNNLEVLHENDEIMLNYITLIPCNPEMLKNINSAECIRCGKCAKECPASIIVIQEVEA